MRRVFTPDEVNRLVPTLEDKLAEVQGIMERLRDARDQLADLRIIWGPKVEQAECPDHEEYKLYLLQFQKHEEQMRSSLQTIHALGCEVKGLWLVDWDNGDGYYCWKYPEVTISYFHGYEDGFAGRVPIN